jgi:methylglutaconyl-CoA hydratase
MTHVLAGGAHAQSAAKTLIADLSRSIDDALIEETAERIATIRTSPEAREGLAAFLEKRKPRWAG